MKAGARRLGIGYAVAARNLRLAILAKVFPGQIFPGEEHELFEDLILLEMCEGWNKEFIFTVVHFRQGIIVVECATVDSADWLRAIVPNLSGWKRTEL